jgi:hypothetical protein
MSESALPQYRNPFWINKENRSIQAEILFKGNYTQAIINAGPASEGKVNRDYDAIIEMFGEEEIDRLTQIKEDEKQLEVERRLAQEEVHQNRVKQEALFNMKLEAFEIPEVKNSEEKDLKKMIRKAKTIVEVNAYTTILLWREYEKAVDAK